MIRCGVAIMVASCLQRRDSNSVIATLLWGGDSNGKSQFPVPGIPYSHGHNNWSIRGNYNFAVTRP